MLHEMGTNPETKAEEILAKFLGEVLNTDPWNRNIGKKGVTFTVPSQSEPEAPYIRFHKLGGREPWTCGLNEHITFLNYQLVFRLDVRVPETDQRTPKEPTTKLSITNPKTNRTQTLGDNGKIVENICNALKTVMEIPKWRMKLSSMGLHNPSMEDERETYQGTDYVAPLRLVVEINVLI